MKWITDPEDGSEHATFEQLQEWEDVYCELGAKKQDFGFLSVCGWMAENGKEYEYRPEDYVNEEPHDGENLGECMAITYNVAKERNVPFVSGFAINRFGTWLPHCWNLNEDGRVLDLTWHCPQYMKAKERRYIGRRVKGFSTNSDVFLVLYGSVQKAQIYFQRWEYVLHQVAAGRYIVRDWYELFQISKATSWKILRESEFANQMTIQQCEDYSCGLIDVPSFGLTPLGGCEVVV